MPVAPIQRLFYSRKEAAVVLNVSLRQVAYLLARNELRAAKSGGRRPIPVVEVERYASKLMLLAGIKRAVHSGYTYSAQEGVRTRKS